MTTQTKQLQSTAINSATYDDTRESLVLVFTDGRRFTYDGVPESVFNDLCAAPSPGRYYHQNIKDQY